MRRPPKYRRITGPRALTLIIELAETIGRVRAHHGQGPISTSPPTSAALVTMGRTMNALEEHVRADLATRRRR